MRSFVDRHAKKLTGLLLAGTAFLVALLLVEADAQSEMVWMGLLGVVLLLMQAAWAVRLIASVERERQPASRRLAQAEERVRRLRIEAGLPSEGAAGTGPGRLGSGEPAPARG